MKNPIRLLHLEDNPRDAELIQQKLEAGGLACDIVQVSSKADFEAALEREPFDLVLCDYNLPGYDGISALKHAQKRQPTTPVIMISGALGEEWAVECLKMGATDYILKQRIDRLVPAVTRALVEMEEHCQRREAEAELRESAERLLVLVESVQVGVVMHDAQAQIQLCNPAAQRLLGCSGQDLGGKSAADPYWSFLREDGSPLPVTEYPARRVLATRQPLRDFVAGISTGDPNAPTWVLINANPVFDARGQLSQVIVAFMDITGSRRAEAELRLKSAALEAAANAIVITDPGGVIEWINPAFTVLTGYNIAEAVGRNMNLVKSGRQDQAFYKNLWTTILAGNIWQGEVVNRRKDGVSYTEEMTITPLKDEHGGITHFIGVKQDFTSRKSMEEQFRQAQKMEAVGQLSGGIAHDFNNILQAILLFSELLLGRLKADTEEYRNVAEIKKAADRAADLTRHLMTFSRKQPVKRERIDINAVIQDTEKMLLTTLNHKTPLVLDLAKDLVPVYADAGQLSQLLMNLAINARDVMPDGGQLTFSTGSRQFASVIPGAKAGEFVCLSVTDTGCGMSQYVKDHLFEPFFTTKVVGEGTGLGLSVVYGIVKQHGGWIEVDSEEGRGTTFKIYLPAHKETESPAEPADGPDEPRHERILLVEDDPDMCKLVIHLLQGAGYQVSETGNAKEALALFDSEPDKFDLLFSDIVLPGGNGIELAAEIRKKKPALPVLLYSGYRDQRERWSQIDSQGYHFLQKPFTITALMMAVYEAMTEATKE